MRKRTRFIYNTALLTAWELLLRCVGCAFQVWLAGRIGAAGIGLYQLMGTAAGLAITFSLSGIGFGTLRLVSEQLGNGSTRGAYKAVRCCIVYALCFGCTGALLLYRFAEPIAFLWIGDGRTVLPLKILAWEMPCMALSAVFSAYFTACGLVGRTTAVGVLQQTVTVLLTLVFLSSVPHGDVAQSCAAVTLAGTLSEALGCLVLAGVYEAHRITHPPQGEAAHGLFPRLLGISLPLAVSAYARSGLSTLQHMLTPAGLRRFGLTANGALSVYGIVHGMTLTVIYFPTCILQVVARLLIPHLTQLQVQNQCTAVNRLCTRMLHLAMVYSAAAAAGLFLLADLIAAGIYHTPEVAAYIRMFVPIVPMIFMDIIVDGCLKGLGQQLWSMGINILESAVSVVLTALLVPMWGIKGFVAVVYFNEIFNFLLSFRRLQQTMHNCKTTAPTV